MIKTNLSTPTCIVGLLSLAALLGSSIAFAVFWAGIDVRIVIVALILSLSFSALLMSEGDFTREDEILEELRRMNGKNSNLAGE